MAVEDISQKSYSYRYLGGAVILGLLEIFFYYSYTSIDQTSFFASFGNAIHILFALICAIPLIMCIFKFYKYTTMSPVEWQNFARNRRAFLSIAVYRHPITGDERTVRRGFSIPVFFFGALAPLFKGQFELAFKFFIIIWLAQAISTLIPVIGNILAFFFTHFGLARRYNKFYEDWLIKQGYQLVEANKFTENIKQVNSQIKRLN